LAQVRSHMPASLGVPSSRSFWRPWCACCAQAVLRPRPLASPEQEALIKCWKRGAQVCAALVTRHLDRLDPRYGSTEPQGSHGDLGSQRRPGLPTGQKKGSPRVPMRGAVPCRQLGPGDPWRQPRFAAAGLHPDAVLTPLRAHAQSQEVSRSKQWTWRCCPLPACAHAWQAPWCSRRSGPGPVPVGRQWR